jgi:hypothetical protein
MDDWQNQLNLANKELEQFDKQIASAQVKLDISNKELSNQDLAHRRFFGRPRLLAAHSQSSWSSQAGAHN